MYGLVQDQNKKILAIVECCTELTLSAGLTESLVTLNDSCQLSNAEKNQSLDQTFLDPTFSGTVYNH